MLSHPPRTKTTIRGRRIAIAVVATLATTAAITPSFAATSTAEIDRGAVAAIFIVGTLLLAIVVEAWRLTLRHRMPQPARPRRRRISSLHE